ncbi:DUF3710 domain-containing protein [Natronosporangium hydrolyticum]|uniref:DUF3710 domain-containing protein n=1 Tax=Natronosporangium hydrolyticum TaxID=2811111 RepID=A0A895YHR6_9ACTN|nr:DUF3710 domain-containing protein [Natronosporangium hydrolyticum]QSB17387.1 DUF3710 domain-containing protein [Natronosporangium hydrolyticum]
MMFSRGSRSQGRHARDGKAGRGRAEPPAAESTTEPSGEPGSELGGATAPPAAGPYDSAEAPEDGRLLDLGSLRIPSVSGVEVRVQANKEGVVQQVFLVHGESMLQLGVFAAPRTEQIWDEVRAEIKQTLAKDGVAAEEFAGDYGTELTARVRTQQGPKDLRFVGVSGPRWLVRAVYQGPAAVDPAAAAPLVQCLRGLVVDRGSDARPAKEPLPLRLTEEMAAQVQSRAAANAGAAPGTTGGGAGAAPNGAAASRRSAAGPPPG